MAKTNMNGGNFSRNVEIPSCFGYIGVTDSTPVPDQDCQSDFAAGSVMASPSPLDRCWTLKEMSGSLAILPALRAAVERQWPSLQRAASSALGDESLAGEIMDGAIEGTVAYLADHPPEDLGEVDTVLSRLCSNELGRRRRLKKHLVFIDSSSVAETCASDSALSATDAAIDIEKILRDAPPKVREAMMMRYGSSESWRDVAARTATTPAAIRMSCKRFLDRIREKLGIPGAPQ
jgi:DNA-directed RNA polymerase specialized sigma24 family protein